MSPGFGEPITPGPSQKQSQKEPRTSDEEEDEDEDVPTGGRKFEKKGTRTSGRRGRVPYASDSSYLNMIPYLALKIFEHDFQDLEDSEKHSNTYERGFTRMSKGKLTFMLPRCVGGLIPLRLPPPPTSASSLPARSASWIQKNDDRATMHSSGDPRTTFAPQSARWQLFVFSYWQEVLTFVMALLLYTAIVFFPDFEPVIFISSGSN
ncbi:hypothetical protein WN51_12959 [Melipona quadrifasciata]|uniref:Uncharacterized protein n=1 Tax=Melipona quadrifasciata TaxID=166423 RepID=A0A0M9ABJ6_9HYME|nr:hypothetical protein WN51_12959 [Melipona quadrifasciata]